MFSNWRGKTLFITHSYLFLSIYCFTLRIMLEMPSKIPKIPLGSFWKWEESELEADTVLGLMFFLFLSFPLWCFFILSIQEQGVSFHLFASISFISILQFSEYRSFVSLGRFITGYFILFGAMVHGIVSWISLPNLSLLV